MNWNKILIILLALMLLLVGGCNDNEITLTKGNVEAQTEDDQMVNEETFTEYNQTVNEEAFTGDNQSLNKSNDSKTNDKTSTNINGVNNSDEKKQSATPVGQVYLCGAVNNPGVYDIYADTRLYQVIEAAGGLDEEADIDAINMAGLLSDAQQIRVPYIGENIKVEEDKRININTANIEELCSIPGIGEARAQAIIDYRESVGGFESAEDLMQISGIKEATFNKIKNYIRIN